MEKSPGRRAGAHAQQRRELSCLVLIGAEPGFQLVGTADQCTVDEDLGDGRSSANRAQRPFGKFAVEFERVELDAGIAQRGPGADAMRAAAAREHGHIERPGALRIDPLDPHETWRAVVYVASAGVQVLAPVLIVAWVAAALSHIGQIGWLFAPKAVTPSFGKLK